jgi:hypothetical protein
LTNGYCRGYKQTFLSGILLNFSHRLHLLGVIISFRRLAGSSLALDSTQKTHFYSYVAIVTSHTGQSTKSFGNV